eukprot:1900342-Pyramimonas_sp.AAC.1
MLLGLLGTLCRRPVGPVPDMGKSGSRLPRRDGDYRLLDLLSLRLVRRLGDRSLCLWLWMNPQGADVRTDFGGDLVRRWPRGPLLCAGAECVATSSI